MSLTPGKFIEPDGSDSEVQPTKSSIVGPEDLWQFGVYDYNDLGTGSTPIVITPGVFVPLTNDGLGTRSLSIPATNVTKVWDLITQRFDFSELSVGDMVDIRLDVDITTTTNNQEYSLGLEVSQGGDVYEIPWTSNKIIKTPKTDRLTVYNGIYIGNTDTRDFPAQFKVISDGNATVRVHGFYCKVIKKGY